MNELFSITEEEYKWLCDSHIAILSTSYVRSSNKAEIKIICPEYYRLRNKRLTRLLMNV